MAKKKLTLEEKFERVRPVLIGIWRFWNYRSNPKLCCTFSYQGKFYDTPPRDTPGQALDAVWNNWQGVKRRKREARKGWNPNRD